jgi:leucyl aminopeptidase (aminopeptidase T)
MGALEQAVGTVVDRCVRVRHGESVLVVADPDSAALGESLMDAARGAGADAVLTILPPNPARGTEPPPPVAAAFAAADVFIAPCLPSLSHTSARKRASDAGARGATMPGVTADLLARLMSADFDAMGARCHALARLLSEADDGHLTCARGTDLTLDLRGRTASPTTATSAPAAPSATCPAARASRRPPAARGRSRPPRTPAPAPSTSLCC